MFRFLSVLLSHYTIIHIQWLIQKIPKGGAPNLWFLQTVGGGSCRVSVISTLPTTSHTTYTPPVSIGKSHMCPLPLDFLGEPLILLMCHLAIAGSYLTSRSYLTPTSNLNKMQHWSKPTCLTRDTQIDRPYFPESESWSSVLNWSDWSDKSFWQVTFGQIWRIWDTFG